MSSDRRDERADLALRQLATSVVPLERPDRAAEQRARLLPDLTAFAEAEFQTSSRRIDWRRLVIAAAAIAGIAALATFLVMRSVVREVTLRASEGTVRVSHDGTSDMVHGPRPLAAADLLETLDGTAEVSLATGAVVDLAARSRLSLGAVDRTGGSIAEHLVLSSGKVSVHVPKLPSGSKLMVGTPDATVTVHGTAFTVEVTRTSDGKVTTTVIVTEGRVGVDSSGRQLLLGPGSHWSSAPRTPDATTESPAPATSREVAITHPTPANGFAARHSTLRAENELFRAAIAAQRSGDMENVVTLTQRLLRAHPDSPLAADARALQAEALQKLGRGPNP